MVSNEHNELILTHIMMGWCVCIDYRKLNDTMRKEHLPLLFIDQMLERMCGHIYYYFLDGMSGYLQISVSPEKSGKGHFHLSYGTFVYRRMPFGLYNALATFQRCMISIFDGWTFGSLHGRFLSFQGFFQGMFT